MLGGGTAWAAITRARPNESTDTAKNQQFPATKGQFFHRKKKGNFGCILFEGFEQEGP